LPPPSITPRRRFVDHLLQPGEAAHAGEQGDVVDGLVEEVVGPGLQPRQPVAAAIERGDHHHRNVLGGGIGFKPAADLEPVHARHHHVEQNHVGPFGLGHGDAGGAVAGAQHLVILGLQLGFQQADIGLDVVNDQDAG
jgi:hypothetical protein